MALSLIRERDGCCSSGRASWILDVDLLLAGKKERKKSSTGSQMLARARKRTIDDRLLSMKHSYSSGNTPTHMTS